VQYTADKDEVFTVAPTTARNSNGVEMDSIGPYATATAANGGSQYMKTAPNEEDAFSSDEDDYDLRTAPPRA
jgi:hypothetical protein